MHRPMAAASWAASSAPALDPSQAEFGTTARTNQACPRGMRDNYGHGAKRADLVPRLAVIRATLCSGRGGGGKSRSDKNGEGTMRYSRSTEHPDGTMGNVLAFPSRTIRADLRVLPYGAWLTDARLSSLGFSAEDIRAIRSGEPIGRVVARRKGRSRTPPAGSSREIRAT
jgi:hypothetical protein